MNINLQFKSNFIKIQKFKSINFKRIHNLWSRVQHYFNMLCNKLFNFYNYR